MIDFDVRLFWFEFYVFFLYIYWIIIIVSSSDDVMILSLSLSLSLSLPPVYLYFPDLTSPFLNTELGCVVLWLSVCLFVSLFVLFN